MKQDNDRPTRPVAGERDPRGCNDARTTAGYPAVLQASGRRKLHRDRHIFDVRAMSRVCIAATAHDSGQWTCVDQLRENPTAATCRQLTSLSRIVRQFSRRTFRARDRRRHGSHPFDSLISGNMPSDRSAFASSLLDTPITGRVAPVRGVAGLRAPRSSNPRATGNPRQA
jgi:hypothetical protein